MSSSRPTYRATLDPLPLSPSSKVLEHLRTVMFRAGPLSLEEREAFALFSNQLKRQLDASEDALERVGASTASVKALRYLLEAVPGFTV